MIINSKSITAVPHYTLTISRNFHLGVFILNTQWINMQQWRKYSIFDPCHICETKRYNLKKQNFNWSISLWISKSTCLILTLSRGWVASPIWGDGSGSCPSVSVRPSPRISSAGDDPRHDTVVRCSGPAVQSTGFESRPLFWEELCHT